ncbi:conserved hypothetical protein [Klebsiella grimontii]|uniref:Uncharacterized protein n=1 Tax=Klebsiella grimontii TaxID=2058152 RepID=A0A285AYS0_9ENTR|nr:conserved hypothetical protein [Klebsiella grimontii]
MGLCLHVSHITDPKGHPGICADTCVLLHKVRFVASVHLVYLRMEQKSGALYTTKQERKPTVVDVACC